MDEDFLDEDLQAAICDKLEGWELVEFLNLDIEDIVNAFEEEILENIEDVKDFIIYGVEPETEEND